MLLSPKSSLDASPLVTVAWGGVVYQPYKGAKADGLKGFGKGVGKGLGNLFFPKRGLFQVNGKAYGMRALYDSIKTQMGAGTLSFILAAHFAEGFEQANAASEGERLNVISKWQELSLVLKRKKRSGGNGPSSPMMSLTSTRSSASISRTGSDAGPSMK